MLTAENNVFHITGNANGFFANKSTDSIFNPEVSDDYPNQYVFKNIVFWEKPAEMNFTDSDGKSMRTSNIMLGRNRKGIPLTSG